MPHVAVLHSSAGIKHEMRAVYRAWAGELVPEQGVVAALLHGQHSVELLMEHHLRGRMRECPVIVVPEWAYLESAFRDELVRYATDGGNLLVVGTEAVRLFEHEAQVAAREPGTEAFGTLHPANDLRTADTIPPATVRRVGRGRIAGIYLDLGRAYLQHPAPFARAFLADHVRMLVPAPPVEVAGSRLVHVATGRLPDGRLAVHLVNAGGLHASPAVVAYDELPPLGPLTVRVRLPHRPRRVTWEPDGSALPSQYQDGVLAVRVPRLAVHGAVVIR